MKFIRIAVVALFAILVATYLAIIGPTTKQNAATFGEVNGAGLTINAHDNGSCPDGNNNTNTSYGGYFTIKNNTDSTRTLHTIVHRYWCAGSIKDCQDHDSSYPVDVTINPQDTQRVDVNSYSTTQACGVPGTYQADLELSGYTPRFQSAIWCYSTPVCQATPTNTPVPPTATPTQPVCNVYCNRTVDQNGCYQVKSHNSCSCDTVCRPTATPTPTKTVSKGYACTTDHTCRLVEGGLNTCAQDSDCAAPTATPTPTTGTTQQCPNGYIVQIINSMVFCMQQTQVQTQVQTQEQHNDIHIENNPTNNNNISFASWAPAQQQQQQQIAVQPAPQATSLPNTGTPLGAWAVISGLPIGLIIKRFTKWS